jgi:putative transposase
MPRRARLSIAGIPWHIIQRGNNRSACFYSEENYLFYLEQLHQQSEKFGCAIHAYCLMTNHVHILLTPESTDSVSLMMKNLGQRFVQYINRTYCRSGTLWEGRFKSCLVQSENYALTCYRYIELNPVRAKMVCNPQDYPWSSFAINGNGKRSSLIAPHSSYLALGETASERLIAYARLFDNPIKESVLKRLRDATNGNFALGDDLFKLKVEQVLQRRVTRARAGRPRKAD